MSAPAPRVVVRADASPEIGAGHLARTRVLAGVLRRRGAEVTFVTRAGQADVAVLRRDGHQVISLASRRVRAGMWLPVAEDQDAAATVAALGGDHYDWLVVDGYGFSASWVHLLRAHVGAVLALDDLADRPLDCDVLLDASPEAGREDRYRSLVPASARLLIGPRYALVDPRLALTRTTPARPPGVLVYFGSTDRLDVTRLAVRAVLDTSQVAMVVVVLGGFHPHEQALRSMYDGHPRVTLLGRVDDMPALLRGATLVVSSGGMISVERCAVGRAGIVVTVADNQVRVAKALAAAGTQLSLGPAAEVGQGEIEAAVSVLLALPELRDHMAAAGAALVDARGAERVADVLLAPSVSVRLATLEDARFAHAWRQDPRVRGQFLDPRPVPWEEHKQWFSDAVTAENRLLLVGEEHGRAVGLTRFDIDGARAVVSIYLDPDRHGRGFGSELLDASLRRLAEDRPEVTTTTAHVLPSNIASRKLFEGAGFRVDRVSYRRGR